MGWLVVFLALGVVGSAQARQSSPLPGETPGPPALLALGPGGTTAPVPAVRACWAVGGQGPLCYTDLPTGDEPLLVVPPGAIVAIGFATGSPLTIAITRLDAGGVRLPVTAPDRDLFVADFPLGTHNVIVTTTWPQGSADYLFRVEIRPVPIVRDPLDRTG